MGKQSDSKYSNKKCMIILEFLLNFEKSYAEEHPKLATLGYTKEALQIASLGCSLIKIKLGC